MWHRRQPTLFDCAGKAHHARCALVCRCPSHFCREYLQQAQQPTPRCSIARNRAIACSELAGIVRKQRKVSRGIALDGCGQGRPRLAISPTSPKPLWQSWLQQLGAIWSLFARLGSRSVLDRFSQIEPKVLIVDITMAAKPLTAVNIAELQAELPTLQKTILIPEHSHQETPRGHSCRRVHWQHRPLTGTVAQQHRP